MPKSYVSRGTSGQNVLRRLAQPLVAVSNGRVEVARGVVFEGVDPAGRVLAARVVIAEGVERPFARSRGIVASEEWEHDVGN